ncbi:MAG: hypothetical protein R6V85_12035 [Polyangia bacterium]
MQRAGAARVDGDEIARAQEHETYWIGGRRFSRVPFGRERWSSGAEDERCPDCGAALGQLHVPGCEEEQCPACSERVLGCECLFGKRAAPTRH